MLETIFMLAVIIFVCFCLIKTIRNAGIAARSLKRTKRAKPTQEKTFLLTCQRCGQKLQLPCNKGTLKVTCPKCLYVFQCNSYVFQSNHGAKAPSDPFTNLHTCGKNFKSRFTPPGTGAPPSVNELAAYAPGGALRTELPQPGSCNNIRQVQQAVIASWSGSMLANNILDPSSSLWQSLDNLKLDFVICQFTASGVQFEIHAKGIPKGHSLNYSYNEVLEEDGGGPTIVLSPQEIQLVQSMAFSHLVDLKPAARMQGGRISA